MRRLRKVEDFWYHSFSRRAAVWLRQAAPRPGDRRGGGGGGGGGSSPSPPVGAVAVAVAVVASVWFAFAVASGAAAPSACLP